MAALQITPVPSNVKQQTFMTSRTSRGPGNQKQLVQGVTAPGV